MNQVQGVVARAKGEPVSVETVTVPDPGPGEAVVNVQACGVCHTDLHYREGGINDDFPFLLGHEAAGTVSAVGAFAEKTLVHSGQCTKVDPQAPATAAGLLGCGVMAGVGAAMNTGAVKRGESVAVFGCGGVGDAAIAGAKLAGATTIVAVDIDDRKLAWARRFGATHTVNSKDTDAVAAVKAATNGFGADVTIDAVGHPAVFEQAFYARDLAGRVVLVGVPAPDMTITLPLIEVFGRGGAIKSSWYGDCLPSRDFPLPG